MAECELWATTQGGYPAVPASAASGQEPPWTFFAQIEDALGKDAEPDPAFFIESWTAGLAAAAESFLKRQQRKNREPDPQPPLKLDSFMPFLTVENVGCGEEPEPAAVPAFRLTTGHIVRWPPLREEVEAAAEYVPGPRPEAASSDESSWSPEAGDPLTLERACRLLGVTATATREQIKAAYRHMAGRCHPDRLGRKSEQERQTATKRMASINEAYRLLSNGLV